ncbi:MAG: hypothetical protein ABI720_08915 [Actinomycetes bacterium]
MRLATIAIGTEIGYLAGNEEARGKTWTDLKQAKQSPSAKSPEDKVSGAVSQLLGRRHKSGSDSATPLVPDRSVIG